MLALRYYGPRDLRVEDVPKPVCGPGQVLVKIAYAGICGSDMHNYRTGMFMSGNIPEIMGHEFSGTIEEVGEGVTALTPGLQVVGDPRVSCGHCRWCGDKQINLCPDLGFIGEVAPGCFAGYLLAEPEKLLVIPPEISLQEAALVEPLAVAVHIVKAGGLHNMQAAETLGIMGAGPIGLLTLLAVKALGEASVHVIDIAPERLKLAENLGADECRVKLFGENEGSADAVVEAVGLAVTLQESLRWLKPRGKLVMAGLYEEKTVLDPNPVLTKELRVTGINAYETADLHEAVGLLRQGKIQVGQLVTDVIPLAQAPVAFQDLDAQAKKKAKVLFSMNAAL